MAECAVSMDFFRRRGCVPSLETITWSGNRLIHPPVAFLQANPQITILALPCSVSSKTLGLEIIPLISKSFANLVSLFLVWADVSIPESDVEMISRIKTLKQIHLSAGDQYGHHYNWLIEHKTLRKHLRTLPSLEKMAFSRDTYGSYDAISPGSYYAQGVVFGDATAESDEWERNHRQMIVAEGQKYVDVIPTMDWMCFGQIPMAVRNTHEDNRTVYATQLEGRNSSRAFLRKMFGCATSYDCSC